MTPIFEQGKGRGIGHDLASFSDRFTELCQEHVRNGRAKAFAFIFYDFNDEELRKILKDNGVFAQLDRLSGSNLTVFYLHSGSRKTVERFNAKFLSRLDVEEDVRLPAVVFFRVKEDHVEDVAVAQLESSDLVHGFHELYAVIERYIRQDLLPQGTTPRYIRWMKSSSKFIGLEMLRAALKAGLEEILRG